ncbi:MAG TPA: fatty acid desaturase family protein [Cyclobacteriaceae bacterium]
MKDFPAEITDPTFDKNQSYSRLDKFFISKIRDERDLPFVYLTLKISTIMIPLAILLYMPFISGWLWWGIAAAHFYVSNFMFKGPFGLMLHCTSHRPWFKKQTKFMNSYLPWFAGLFFGQTPETYKSHHIGMHHKENNLNEDESSTMQYQRDGMKDFHRYFADFITMGVIKVAQYFHFRRIFKLRDKVIRGEIFFYLLCIGLSFVNFAATFFVFILPWIISRYIMMLGNFTQHAFVDYRDPGNSYKNSITVINENYNHKCWNDGYHISHHIKPSMHWTEHPNHLLENLDEYADNKALVFEGINFIHIWYYLMRRDYNKLVANLVNINDTFSSDEEAIALMKLRTRKIDLKASNNVELAVA